MTGAKFRIIFNLATCSNYSITNYVKIPGIHFFEKMNKGQLKNHECQLLRMARSHHIAILIKS